MIYRIPVAASNQDTAPGDRASHPDLLTVTITNIDQLRNDPPALIRCQPYVGPDPFNDMRAKLAAYTTASGAKLRGLNVIMTELDDRYKNHLFTF